MVRNGRYRLPDYSQGSGDKATKTEKRPTGFEDWLPQDTVSVDGTRRNRNRKGNMPKKGGVFWRVEVKDNCRVVKGDSRGRLDWVECAPLWQERQKNLPKDAGVKSERARTLKGREKKEKGQQRGRGQYWGQGKLRVGAQRGHWPNVVPKGRGRKRTENRGE